MPKLIRVTTVPMALKHLLSSQMRYMRESGFTVIMISADGKEREDVILAESCEHHIIPMTRKVTPFSDLKSLWLLYHFFRNEKPDIVHSHTPKAGLVSMLAAKLAGVKIRIHTVAGLRFMTSRGLMRNVLISMEKITAHAATHVWPNSFSLLNYINSNRLFKPAKMEVIGQGSTNGISLERFSPAALFPEKLKEIKSLIQYDQQYIYLLNVGRIVKDKGIEELLRVFKRLHDADRRLRLILLGSFEPELDPISDEARRMLDSHRGVIHIQWNDAVEYFMHLATLFVHPSHREGFPNVLLQAGAMYCPIACSRIEGNVDIVTESDTGILFESKNEKDMEDKLQYALNHPAAAKQYAINLRKKIELHYDRQFVQEALKNRYYKLLDERNQNR